MEETKPDDELKREILKTFLVQFAENQNHLQQLFVQFFIAIIAVVGGYGYVAMGITSESEMYNLKNGSYPIIYLIVVFVITQTVLVALNSFVGCNAYNFRRDQGVVYKIRERILGNEYADLFGKKSFNPYNKTWMMWNPFYPHKEDDYMPTFYILFWQFIIVVQIILSVIFLAQIKLIGHVEMLCFIICIILAAFFIGLSIFWHHHYFKKYKKKVDRNLTDGE